MTPHPRTIHAPETVPELPLSALPPAQPPQSLRIAHHDLTVFVESPHLLDAMLADILAARHRIWLEVYIFYHDPYATRIAEALQKKAREGLDVRLLYDAFGSATTSSVLFSSLAAAGVKVHAYHSLFEGLLHFRPLTLLNRRNHRKLLIIDDAIGYFGGMNIIDNAEPVRPRKPAPLAPSTAWRDVHLRLLGPQQSELADSFDRSWRRAHHEKIPRRPRAYRRALHLANSDPAPESIHFFDSGPGRKYSRAARVFSLLLRKARHDIVIAMAYFVPTGRTLRALLRARRRRVHIRVIVPGISDVPLVQRATSYLYSKLIRRGFRIYERRQRMLHSKIMIVDGLYTLVGSANLDPRSLYTNLEFLAVIRSPAFAAIMTQICRFEIAHSQRIIPARTRLVPWPQRLLNQFAWSLRWWL